jgi:predicted DNA-binding transcriptional regulator AlpA
MANNEKILIIQLTEEELKNLIENSVTTAVRKVLQEIEAEKVKPTAEEEDTWLSINQTAKILGKSRQSCYSYCKRKPSILTPYKITGTRGLRFKKSEVEQAVQKVTFKYLQT